MEMSWSLQAIENRSVDGLPFAKEGQFYSSVIDMAGIQKC
jgi:hypothetical protein